jgi:hypothetical protein
MLVPILLVPLFGALVSCSRGTPVAEHTVSEYRADATLRREVFARCLNDPGGLGQTLDCVNAREAERLESRGSLRDQPPVGLDPSGRR